MPVRPSGTLVLTRQDIRGLLTFDDYIIEVERAFRLHAEGRSLPPGLLHADADGGEFHIKSGGLRLSKLYFGLKVNGGFFQNMARFGMPNIQGSIILCDGENGYPLAFMDSGEITINRTGAATAVAARLLARGDSAVATICGCGRQGAIQLRALARVLPIARAFAFDVDGAAARTFATTMSEALAIEVTPTTDVRASIRASDVCVTCTPSRQAYVDQAAMHAGLFVAAIGADSPEKQELDPRILASARVVADILEQCAAVGELHHAIAAGLMTKADVHAELGQIVAGQKPGRSSAEDVIVYDATGTALQDVVSAAAAYERAVERGVGRSIDLALNP